MRRLSSLLTALTSIVGTITSTTVFAAINCDNAIAALTPLARSMSVQIQAPQTLRVGSTSTISVQWSFESRPPQDVPLYFIVGTKAAVRFVGLGFMALSEDAAGPSHVRIGAGQTRAVVPLHNPTAQLTGSISIKPLRAGEIEFTWSFVAATDCGEHLIAQGKSATTVVSPGARRMVIQNLYDLESPDQIVLSNNGKYRLHVFPTRFRVFDVSSGALIIESQGRDPNFSPTSRFLAAYSGARTGLYFDLFDLESGQVIGHPMGPALIWQNGDSVLVAASDRYQHMQMMQTLVDDSSIGVQPNPDDNDEKKCPVSFITTNSCDALAPAALLADFWGCNGCGAAWGEVRVAVSVDTGVAAVWKREDGNHWSMRPYSLGYLLGDEAPETQEHRFRQIDRRTRNLLKRLVRPEAAAAPGPTSHAPAANWTAWGTRDRAHDGRQLDGVRELQSRLRTHQRLQPMLDPIKQSSTPWRNRKVPFIDPQRASLSRLLVEQLSEVGVKLPQSERLKNEVISVQFKGYDKDILSVSNTSRDLNTLLKPFLEGGGKSNNLDPRTGCRRGELIEQHTQDGDDGFTTKFLVGCAHGLWFFNRGNDRYLIGQTLYTYGTDHETVLSMTFLFTAKPGERVQVKRLNDGFLPDEMGRYETGDSGFQWPGNVHRIMLVDKRYLIFASPGDGAARLFDLDSLQPIGKEARLDDVDLLQSVHVTSDKSHFVQLNSDGRLTLSRVTDGEVVLTGRTIDDELLLATADGRYEGTLEAGHFVYLSFAGERGLNSFQQFETSLRTPGIVQKALTGGAEIARVDLAPPPIINLEVISERTDVLTVALTTQSELDLATLRFALDGVPALEMKLQGHRQQLVVDIPNRQGTRMLTALATDVAGTTSRSVSVNLSSTNPATSVLRVLAVGINDYRDDSFPSLAHAASDANSVTATLAKEAGKLFAEYDIRPPLVNAQATPEAIRGGLEQIVRAAKPGDTVVFSFAGHGVTDPRTGRLWLATSNTSFETLSTTALPWDEVRSILSLAPAKVIVLLDACHAGAADFDRLTRNDNLVRSLLSGTRAPILVFAASKGRERSLEGGDGGVFTRAFANALSRTSTDRNGDGLIDASELYYAVKSEVVSATAGRQTPWFARSDLLGDIPLFEYTRGSEAIGMNEAGAKAFVLTYWRIWSQGGEAPIDFLDSVFAENVQFYGARKSRAEVINDRKSYANRWQTRAFSVHEKSIKSSCNRTKRTCRVEGVMDWSVSDNRSRRASGLASFTFELERKDDSFRISTEIGDVLKRN
jgi:caspase domain-containing protein